MSKSISGCFLISVADTEPSYQISRSYVQRKGWELEMRSCRRHCGRAVSAFSVFAVLCTVLPVVPAARSPLTFAQRVKAQEAIERVYYKHRIWPKSNPGPRPPFEQMAPHSVIVKKVKDYLKESAALDKFWHRPIRAQQLQAEMDRMAKGTKDPETLRELYKALNNDPYLIAECLARPSLADRQIRNWYANDERFHKEEKAEAEAAQNLLSTNNFESISLGQLRIRTVKRQGKHKEKASLRILASGLMGQDSDSLSPSHFARLAERAREGKRIYLTERGDAFVLTKIRRISGDELEIESRLFPKKTFDDWWAEKNSEISLPESIGCPDPVAFRLPSISDAAAPCSEGWKPSSLGAIPDGRIDDTAVWTGSEMIVWGGNNCNDLRTGGRYNPSTDTWTSTSTGIGCPSARSGQTAVWTGTEMIIWGGTHDNIPAVNTGARYNPLTDSWTPTSVGANCPSARTDHTAVWTGSEMIVWGGDFSGSGFDTGGRYDPETDSWASTSTAQAPVAREFHTAIWTGSEMIVWGGVANATYCNTGGRYDPSSDTWTPTSTNNAPTGREYHTAVWTGSEMIVWGGLGYEALNTGGRYDPVTDKWIPTSVGVDVPDPRFAHTAVWTGHRMIVWGGIDNATGRGCSSGGLFDPATDTWRPTSTGANCPLARSGQTAIWTGTEMIIWGGSDPYAMDLIDSVLKSGGRYNPTSDSWVPTGGIADCPEPRFLHVSAWTGNEMLIWGGCYNLFDPFLDRELLNSGALYTPATDSWTPISQGPDCPQARAFSVAVWDGREVIIWGGEIYDSSKGSACSTNTGGKYSPVLDKWTRTSVGSGCPYGTLWTSAVWTGREMIIWGGVWTCGNYYGYPWIGGKYDPTTNTWSPISSGADCPAGREWQSTVWTGTEMIVWGGGQVVNGDLDTYDNGGRYNPLSDTWTAIPSSPASPEGRILDAAVWTGTEMIVWGGDPGASTGYLNTGGRYNPATNSWKPTSTVGAPSNRAELTAVWTGKEMIVWGGQNGLFPRVGGRYDPSSDTWTPTSSGEDCPSGRIYDTAVWTGTGMIVWGGCSDAGAGPYGLSSGGIFSPGTTLTPRISGPSTGCKGSSVVLTTDDYQTYQWYKNATLVPGANKQDFTTSEDGSYQVSVTDRYGCTGVSGSKDVTFTSTASPPTTPTGVFATEDCGGIKLQWDASEGATSYKVLRGSECGAALNAFSSLESPFEDSSAEPGKAYQYWVVGVNACGTSPKSACVSATRPSGPNSPSAPTLTNLGPTENVAQWPAVPGATSYDVWRANGDTCENATQITPVPVTGTTYDDSGLEACKAYSYYIVANNECGSSPEGVCAGVTTSALIPAAPSAPTFDSVGCETLTVTWPPVDSATGYDVWRAEGPTCAGAVKVTESPVTGTTFTDAGVTALTQYTYYVVARNNCGASDSGVCASVTTTSSPATPVGVSATGTCTGIVVSWPPSEGATSYNLMRGTSCGLAVHTFDNVSSPYLDTSAVAGNDYRYWLVGVNACGTSPDSNCVSGARLRVPPSPAAPTFTDLTGTSLTVHWQGVPGATSYDVWRSAGSTCSGAVKIDDDTVLGTFYSDTGLSPGTEYSYFITANSTCGVSTQGICAEITTDSPPPAPVIENAVVGNTTIAMTWNAVADPISGIDHYTVYGGAAGPETTNTTTFQLSGLQQGTEYDLTVTATNGVGLESAPSNAVCVSTTSQDLAPQSPCSTTVAYPDGPPMTFTFTGGGDTKWRVEVCSDAGLTQMVTASTSAAKKWLTQTSWTPGSGKWHKILAGGSGTGVVYWRIIGKLGEASVGRTLLIAPAASALAQSPVDGASLPDTSPVTFTWSLDHNKKVQVEFSSTSDFSSGVQVSSKSGQPGKTWIKGSAWTPPNGKWHKIVALGGTIYWRIHSMDAMRRETYSPVYVLHLTQ